MTNRTSEPSASVHSFGGRGRSWEGGRVLITVATAVLAPALVGRRRLLDNLALANHGALPDHQRPLADHDSLPVERFRLGRVIEPASAIVEVPTIVDQVNDASVVGRVGTGVDARRLMIRFGVDWPCRGRGITATERG